MINLYAIMSRHRAATEVGRKSTTTALTGVDQNILFACCSDVPELLDFINDLRAHVADEIETFANQCATSAESIQDQMTTCANDHNLGIVEAYRQAANIARVGQDYRNANCGKCQDTRGGPVDHKTEDCTWSPPVGLFEERDQCYGRDMIQVGWMTESGMIPYSLHPNDPKPYWSPIFMRKAI